MSTNDDIRDAFIRHQIFVQRYAKGREREAEEFIRKVLDEAVSRLNIDLTELSRARLDRLIQDLVPELRILATIGGGRIGPSASEVRAPRGSTVTPSSASTGAPDRSYRPSKTRALAETQSSSSRPTTARRTNAVVRHCPSATFFNQRS